jgi:beta-phosphoglucomutase-like phosphatase (HAD superfamily)
MPSMTTHADTHAPAEAAESTTLAALILELDGVALDTRATLCETATASLKKAGVKLNPALFARYGLKASAAGVAQSLVQHLDVSGLTAEALEGTLAASLEAHLSGPAKLNPAVEKLIKAALHRGLPVALLTALPEELARATADRLGLTASNVRVFAFKDDESSGFPRADIWLKVAKAMGKSARFCVAVTSSQVSAKTALSSGMRCVVAPDSFTGFHDFGGADIILESWDDMSANELLDAVVPLVS